MRLAVALRHKATAVAGARGVAWINQYHGHARKLCLVADKLSQLAETPVVLLCPLLSANRHPGPNVRQVFEHNHGHRVFSMSDNALGNAVVHPSLKARLFTRHLFEATLSAFSMRRLVGLTCSMPAFSIGLLHVLGLLPYGDITVR